MPPTEKHLCAGHVYGDRIDYPCSRNGSLHENGKWWCHQHAPSTIKAKRDAQDAAYEARGDARRDADARAAALSKRAGASIRNVRSFREPLLPTQYVSISEADLDRLLKEAGR